MPKIQLTLEKIRNEANLFSKAEATHEEPTLYGVNNGKAVGTYLEHKFEKYLATKYNFLQGNSASGIDFPGLKVDMKVTSIRQPQSSCPFKSARQKIFGLGYHLLIFVYNKTDNATTLTSNLDIQHVIFVAKDRTADWQTTNGLLDIIENEGNTDDIIAFFEERRLPVDDIQAISLAKQIIENPPRRGYLTISNALQWRLQYSRVIQKANHIDGIFKVL